MKRVSKKTKTSTKETVANVKKRNTSFIRKNLKYIFLVLIIFYIGTHFYNAIYEESVFLNFQTWLIVPTIIVGITSIYFDKEKLTGTINKLYYSENKKGKKRLVQRAKGLFSKKEIFSTSLFLIVLGVSVFTLFYKLDNFDIFSDEVQVIQGAAGYYHTGEHNRWDFVAKKPIGKSENRGRPHQFIVAQSYKLFGINTWAARFPSAFLGVLLIIFLFFIGKFFIRDNWAVLLASLSVALYFEFLFLGRWARMYAMVFPFFLLAFYWLYMFLNGTTKHKMFNSNKKTIISTYLNFNYIILPFLLILLYLNVEIHKNTALLFPVFFVFSIISALMFPKEKKYITASLVAIGMLSLQILNPIKEGFSRFTFFEIQHLELYANYLFGYPFSVNTSIIFLAIGLSFLFFVKNIQFKKRFFMLFVISIVTFILFGSVFDFNPSYRYVSFATPLTILLIIGIFVFTIKLLYNNYIQVILTIIIIASLGIHFESNFSKLYVENSFSPAKPSIAHKSLVENFQKGDVIFRHYGPKIYLKGIERSTQFFEIGGKRGKSLKTLFNQMKEHSSGWLIWHTDNEYRLDQKFISYANRYFKKYTGYGIDSTGEEIYYFKKSMLKPLEKFAREQYVPTANLQLSNPYSFVFDLKINKSSSGTLFSLKSDSITNINCLVVENKLIISILGNDSTSVRLSEEKSNHIHWNISPNKIRVFVDGKQLIEKNISLKSDLVKFEVDPFFNGNIDNIRIYGYILSDAQAKVVQEDKVAAKELICNNNKFNTLFLWKKKEKRK